MNERDTELAKQAWTVNDWDGYVDLDKFAALIRADERKKLLAGERIRIGVRLDTLKTAIALLKAENTELKDELKARGNT